MKLILFIISFPFIAGDLLAQKRISLDSLQSYIGQNVIVCSEVYGVKSTDKVTFINLGAPYPKSPLTLVIFNKDLINFKDNPANLYDHKKICVTGILKEYKSKPEIVVSKPEAIKIE